MAHKSPFDISTFSELFDPKKIAELYSAEGMKSWLSQFDMENLDKTSFLSGQSDYLKELVEANQQAAESYKKLMECQSEIFEKCMAKAKALTEDTDLSGSANSYARNMKLYTEAFQLAKDLMQELAQEHKAAAEQAYQSITEKVEKSLKSLSPE